MTNGAELLAEQPDYSREAFYARYGEAIDIDEHIFNRMWIDSETLMPPVDSEVYSYHNADHPHRALWDAMAECDRLQSIDPNLDINRKVLALAVLFHDVRYDRDPSEHGFESKEAYSAHIMSTMARGYGFTDAETKFAERIIMVTKLGTPPETIEEEIMIQADISNVSRDYDTEFMPANVKLEVESWYEKWRKGEKFDHRNFQDDTIKIISTYLSFLDPRNPFVRKAMSNMQRYAREVARERDTDRTRYLYGLGHAAVRKVYGLRTHFVARG